ncbi:MAG: hypothetical protein EOM92_13685 [Gammaproteobacteria bacterium]|nr:hypothetical protein [Gammaproteobacteria bacterium]
MPMLNLEPLAATSAMALVRAAPGAENLIRRALHILAEQGCFALGLFLASRGRHADIQAARGLHRALHELLSQADLVTPNLEAPPLNPGYYRDLVTSRQDESDEAALYRLLLTRHLLDRTLTYAVFYAKSH